jgi:hypothetical protein
MIAVPAIIVFLFQGIFGLTPSDDKASIQRQIDLHSATSEIELNDLFLSPAN